MIPQHKVEGILISHIENLSVSFHNSRENKTSPNLPNTHFVLFCVLPNAGKSLSS